MEGAPISVRARFERFPATVKGAFILRGEDRDPHQVVLRETTVVGIGGGSRHPMPVASVTLDVVPHRDVFVPFEMNVADLDPGWYTMTCAVDVDGTPATYDGGRRFCMPWPRATVRRGMVKVGRTVEVGGSTVLVEQVECAGDSITVRMRVDPPAPVAATVSANGDPLPVLDSELDETTGAGTVTAYPVLRTHSSVRLAFQGRRRGEAARIEVDLPA